jgi:hypothetical protein
MTAGAIRDWLQAERSIVVTTSTVANQLTRLRASRPTTALAQEASRPSGLTHDEAIAMGIDSEVHLFRTAQTVPERRAAAKEIRAWIELVRRYPVAGAHGPADAGLAAALSDISAKLKSLVVSQPINVAVVAEDEPEIPVATGTTEAD